MPSVTLIVAGKSSIRPLPALASTDVVTVQSHAALIDGHRMSSEGKGYVLALDPPREVSKNVMYCTTPLLQEHFNKCSFLFRRE